MIDLPRKSPDLDILLGVTRWDWHRENCDESEQREAPPQAIPHESGVSVMETVTFPAESWMAQQHHSKEKSDIYGEMIFQLEVCRTFFFSVPISEFAPVRDFSPSFSTGKY